MEAHLKSTILVILIGFSFSFGKEDYRTEASFIDTIATHFSISIDHKSNSMVKKEFTDSATTLIDNSIPDLLDSEYDYVESAEKTQSIDTLFDSTKYSSLWEERAFVGARLNMLSQIGDFLFKHRGIKISEIKNGKQTKSLSGLTNEGKLVHFSFSFFPTYTWETELNQKTITCELITMVRHK